MPGRFPRRRTSSPMSVTVRSPVRESPSLAVRTGVLDERHSADVRGPAQAKGVWPRRASPTWRYVLLRRFLAYADIAAALLATGSLVVIGSGNAGQLAWALFYLPAWIVIAKLLGLYEADGRSLRHLTVDEIPQIVLWALIGMSGLSLFLEVLPPGRPDASSAIIAGTIAAFSAVALRASARWFWRLVTPPERVAIVGTAESTMSVRRKLELFPDLHMTIVEERSMREVFESGADEWLAGVDRVIVTPASLDELSTAKIVDSGPRTRSAAQHRSSGPDRVQRRRPTGAPRGAPGPRVHDRRPLAFDLVAEAHSRRREQLGRARPALSGVSRHRACDRARQPWTSLLLTAARGARRTTFQDAQVPNDGGERRGVAATVRAGRRPRRARLQAGVRSSDDPRRAVVATVERRRASAARQRVAGRDEPRRSATRAGRVRRPLLSWSSVGA